MPVSKPLDEPMVTTVISLLLQVPPPVSNKVTVWPGQIAEGEAIADGKGFTVKPCVIGQPESGVKEMVAGPEAYPVTSPEPSTVATVGSLLPHVPGVEASASVTVPPWHTMNVPVIGAGNESTLMLVVV